jgi:non-heme chloroperoxidase
VSRYRSRARRRAVPLAVAAGAGVGLGAAAVVAANRRWARTDDPTQGEPLCLPDGDDLTVPATDGALLATRVAGKGPTVVLVHCWTGDRRIWGSVARRLVADGFRVVLYDQRGHGASTVGEDGLSIAAIADDLRCVLEAVDARGAVLAGHSMGGMAAQAFAVAHPEVLRDRVDALVLVATACEGLGFGRQLNTLVGRVLVHPAVDRAMTVGPVAPLLVRGTVGRTACLPHLRAVVDTFAAAAPATRAEFFAAMTAMDLSHGLAGLDVRVTVVAGGRDLLVPARRSRRLAEVTGADLRVLPDAGHMLPWEAASELADLIAAHASHAVSA